MSTPQWQRLDVNAATRRRFRRLRRLSQMRNLHPVLFEQYVGYLYEREGYRAYTTASTGDEGVDLFVRRPFRSMVVQVKRYSGTVGQPVVRDLYGAMIHNRANSAALVTSGTISRAAEEWAQDKPIELVDGHELVSWARRQRLGMSRPLQTLVQLALLALILVVCSSALLLAQEPLRERFAAWQESRPTATATTPFTTNPTLTRHPKSSPTPTATASPSPSATRTLAPTPTLAIVPPGRPTLDLTPERLETLIAPPSFATRPTSDN